jgi:hypothetical protein
MTRRDTTRAIFASTVVAATGAATPAALGPIELPRRRSEGGMSLLQALERRRSTREYSERALPLQALSDLLCAGGSAAHGSRSGERGEVGPFHRRPAGRRRASTHRHSFCAQPVLLRPRLCAAHALRSRSCWQGRFLTVRCKKRRPAARPNIVPPRSIIPPTSRGPSRRKSPAIKPV